MKNFLVNQTPISQKFRSPDLGVTSGSQLLIPNSYLGVQTPKEGIPKLGVNFFKVLAPDIKKIKKDIKKIPLKLKINSAFHLIDFFKLTF